MATFRSPHLRSLLLGSAVALLSSRAAEAQLCPSQGATLAITPPSPVIIGTPLRVYVSGPPGEPYLLAMDTAPGPRTLPPYGCVGLAISPAFHVILDGFRTPFVRIPASGEATLDFLAVPHDPGLIGQRFYFQAAVGTQAAPGIALSNDVQLTIGNAPLRAYLCDVPWLGLFDGVRVLTFSEAGCPTRTDIGLGGYCHRLAAHLPSGILYVARWNAEDIVPIDMNANVPTGNTIGGIPRPLNLAVDATGSFLFALSKTDADQWEVRRIATDTRAATHLWTLGTLGTPPEWELAELAAEPTGDRLFVARPNGLTVLRARDLGFMITLFAESGGVLRGIAFRPDAHELWACGPSGVWIANTAGATPYFTDASGNPSNGPAYAVGSVRDVTFDPITRKAYCIGGMSGDLFRLTPGSTTVERFANALHADTGRIGISSQGTYLIGAHSIDGCSDQPRLLRLGTTPTFVCDMGGNTLFDRCEAMGDVIFR